MYIFTKDIYYNLSGPNPDILEIIEGRGNREIYKRLIKINKKYLPEDKENLRDMLLKEYYVIVLKDTNAELIKAEPDDINDKTPNEIFTERVDYLPEDYTEEQAILYYEIN